MAGRPMNAKVSQENSTARATNRIQSITFSNGVQSFTRRP